MVGYYLRDRDEPFLAVDFFNCEVLQKLVTLELLKSDDAHYIV